VQQRLRSAEGKRRNADGALAPCSVECPWQSRAGRRPPGMYDNRVDQHGHKSYGRRRGSGRVRSPTAAGDTRRFSIPLCRGAVLGIRVATMHAASRLVTSPLEAFLPMMSGSWITCTQQSNDSTTQAYWDWLLVCLIHTGGGLFQSPDEFSIGLLPNNLIKLRPEMCDDTTTIHQDIIDHPDILMLL
jgi:hypothetical protein